MIVEWEGEQISGLMEILGHTEAFHGEIDETGNCCIEGRMISLTRTIPYIAVGKSFPQCCSSPCVENGIFFEVAGVPCKANGGITL